jgi:hypothetical protein
MATPSINNKMLRRENLSISKCLQCCPARCDTLFRRPSLWTFGLLEIGCDRLAIVHPGRGAVSNPVVAKAHALITGSAIRAIGQRHTILVNRCTVLPAALKVDGLAKRAGICITA